ncbi:hypothetical protein [Thiobacillus sp.]
MATTEDNTQILSDTMPATDDTRVDIETGFQASSVQVILDKLGRGLTGLKPAKARIRETAALCQANSTIRQDLKTPALGRLHDHRGRKYSGESCVQRESSQQRLRKVVMKGRGASLPG